VYSRRYFNGSTLPRNSPCMGRRQKACRPCAEPRHHSISAHMGPTQGQARRRAPMGRRGAPSVLELFVFRLTCFKLEYMVISLDDKEKDAKLSLRQTEILAKLNTIVDIICADCPEKCASWNLLLRFAHRYLIVYQSQNFTLSMAATCWSPHLVPHTPAQYPICCPSKATCDIGE
jgi:hypothetical protein